MNNNYIQHWGILGQKWGVRRYQNEDGTLTEEGRLRYRVGKNVAIEQTNNINKRINRLSSKGSSRALNRAIKIRLDYNKVLNNKSDLKKIGTIMLAQTAAASLFGASYFGKAAFAAGGPLAGILGASVGAVASYALHIPSYTPKEVPLTTLSKKAIKKYEKENKK